MARSSSLHRLEASLSPAVLIALLSGIAARWLFEVSPGEMVAAGMAAGGASFILLWLWRGRRRRAWRAAARWWRAERGGALVALGVFLLVAGAGRYLLEATPSQSVTWGLWVALPLWVLWFTASLWRGPLARAAQWAGQQVQGRRTAPRALPKPKTKRTRTRSPLERLSPAEFEALCGQIGTWWGFRTRVVGEAGDGGVDVELWRDGAYVIAQCKHYFDRPVGPGHIRDFYGALIHRGAQSGFFFTSGYFTSGAEDFARGKPIALIDRTYIENAIERYG